MIFLGNGEHSIKEIENLHKDLDEALNLLGGLQQPGHFEYESESESKLIRIKIASLIGGICAAFDFSILKE